MSDSAVTSVDTGPAQVSRRTVVHAPVSEVFALVADPHRHGEIDGSGTVRDTVSGPVRLSEGARFSVRMRQYGIPYRITSTVTGYVPDELVEWQHPLGHRWRWELSPVGADVTGLTQITETFDYRGPRWRTASMRLFGFAGRNAAGIEATLSALRRRFAS